MRIPERWVRGLEVGQVMTPRKVEGNHQRVKDGKGSCNNAGAVFGARFGYGMSDEVVGEDKVGVRAKAWGKTVGRECVKL